MHVGRVAIGAGHTTFFTSFPHLWSECLVLNVCRLCSSATNRLITAKDVGSVQINIAHVDGSGSAIVSRLCIYRSQQQRYHTWIHHVFPVFIPTTVSFASMDSFVMTRSWKFVSCYLFVCIGRKVVYCLFFIDINNYASVICRNMFVPLPRQRNSCSTRLRNSYSYIFLVLNFRATSGFLSQYICISF